MVSGNEISNNLAPAMDTTSLCQECGLIFPEIRKMQDHKRVAHDKRGDYPGYVPLVTGGHLKPSFLNSYAEVKMIKYCYRYMIIVIRKHTRQAPKHFDDRLGLAVS